MNYRAWGSGDSGGYKSDRPRLMCPSKENAPSRPRAQSGGCAGLQYKILKFEHIHQPLLIFFSCEGSKSP